MRTLEEGTRLDNTAEFKFHAAVQYYHDITDKIAGFGRLSYSHTGDTITWREESLKSTVPAYDIFGVRIGLESESWHLSLFVDNIFDEYTILRDSVNGPAMNSPLREYTIGRPRTIGINLKYNF